MEEKASYTVIRENLDRLKEILEDETVHLAQFKPSRLSALYEEKLEVLQNLENQKNLLKASKERMGANPDQQIDFRSLCKEMDDVISRHGTELIKAREANKFLMEAIAQAIKEECKKVGAYDSSGIEGQYISKGESAVPPMKMNQTF
jgi:hypothetical protein